MEYSLSNNCFNNVGIIIGANVSAHTLPIKKPNSEIGSWGRGAIFIDKIKLRAAPNPGYCTQQRLGVRFLLSCCNDWQAVPYRLLNKPEWSNTAIRHVLTFCSHMITSAEVSDSVASGLFQEQYPFYCAMPPPMSSPSVSLYPYLFSPCHLFISLSSLLSLSAALPPPSIR